MLGKLWLIVHRKDTLENKKEQELASTISRLEFMDKSIIFVSVTIALVAQQQLYKIVLFLTTSCL